MGTQGKLVGTRRRRVATHSPLVGIQSQKVATHSSNPAKDKKDLITSFSPRRKATKEKPINPFQLLSMRKGVTQAQLMGTHPEKVATHSPLVETHTQKIATQKNPYYIVETPHKIFSNHTKKPAASAASQQISLFPIHTLNRCAARSIAQFLQQIPRCILILQA